jgi:hypothetical protein
VLAYTGRRARPGEQMGCAVAGSERRDSPTPRREWVQRAAGHQVGEPKLFGHDYPGDQRQDENQRPQDNREPGAGFQVQPALDPHAG